ncbi:Tigger transposable element-derived protein 2, partial [Colletotrichum chlorophyti]
LGTSGRSLVQKKQPGSRAWTSIIECISATGAALPPLVMFKGKSLQQQWFPLDLDPFASWEFTSTENGWTTDPTAVEWLKKVFIPQTCQTGQKEHQRTKLLILDGHGSHETAEFMHLCLQNQIHLLYLPPHTSHVLQPLDQSVFSPLKTAYRKELSFLTDWDDSTIVGKKNFIICYHKARQAALSIQNIKSGWKYTGLWPVSVARPLMSPLLLQKPSTPARPGHSTSRGSASTRASDGWAGLTSEVMWSTPRKASDLRDQLSQYSKLQDNS